MASASALDSCVACCRMRRLCWLDEAQTADGHPSPLLLHHTLLANVCGCAGRGARRHGLLPHLNEASPQPTLVGILLSCLANHSPAWRPHQLQGEGQGAMAYCRIAMLHRGDLPYADAEHLM